MVVNIARRKIVTSVSKKDALADIFAPIKKKAKWMVMSKMPLTTDDFYIIKGEGEQEQLVVKKSRLTRELKEFRDNIGAEFDERWEEEFGEALDWVLKRIEEAFPYLIDEEEPKKRKEPLVYIEAAAPLTPEGIREVCADETKPETHRTKVEKLLRPFSPRPFLADETDKSLHRGDALSASKRNEVKKEWSTGQ